MNAPRHPNPTAAGRRRTAGALALALACAAPALWTPGAGAQTAPPPVYLDDSPRAAEALVRARELASIGNNSDAVRVLQSLIEQEGGRVLPSPTDPDVYIEVRRIVSDLLLSNPLLLDRYREINAEPARRALDIDGHERVERDYFLTAAGYEATLRSAQLLVERARFASACRTLLRLERHPDRADHRGAEASRLLDLALAYLRRGAPVADSAAWIPDLEQTAQRWRAESGRPAPEPGPQSVPTLTIPRTTAAPGDELDLTGLLPRPLWSDGLGDPIPVRPQPTRSEAQRPPYPDSARWLIASPTVVGDVVYVNDGQTVSAWNRFTLTLLWRTKLDGAIRSTYSVSLERPILESTQAAVAEGVVALVTGLRSESQPRETRYIVALDAANGRLLWTRSSEDLGLDDATDSVFTGPALIAEGVVVVRVEKDVTSRRIDGLSLAGFDAHTGNLRWVRPIGSSGMLTFGIRQNISDAVSVARGLVYTSGRVGVVGAVEPASGRTAWVRRVGTVLGSRPIIQDPWDTHYPVVSGGRLFALSPARDRVIALDAETGDLIDSMPAERLGFPNYLLIADNRLAGVNRNGIRSVDLDDFGPDAAAEDTFRAPPDVIRGRVVPVGDRVMVPLISEVVLLTMDPAVPREARIVQRIRLDQPGAVLPLEGQLVVVDDERLHAYLLWEVAERVLRERMESAPRDPTAAITYAELSYRAGHPEGIVTAVDRALSAIEADPLAETGPANLSRVFRSVLAMIEPEEEGFALALDRPLREALVDRLGRSASSTEERATYFLTAGGVYESIAEPARAVRAYQAVLDSPDLAAAAYTLGQTRLAAEFEATRRLRAVIESAGRALYEPYEADAERLLAEARQTMNHEAFEAIARRYPVSRAAAAAWMESASRHLAQGKSPFAALALEEGLAAARLSLDPRDPLIGELGGRLIGLQQRAGLLYPVLDTLERLRADHPGVTLTEMGRPLDASALVQSVRAEIAVSNRRPAIGTAAQRTEHLTGWALVNPLTHESRAPVTDRVVLVSSEDAEIAMWRAAPAPAEGLVRLWGGVRDESLIWMDRRGAYFARLVGEGTIADYEILCRDLDNGEVRWSTPAFRTVVPAGEIDRIIAESGPSTLPRTINTPLEPNSVVTMPILAFDRATLVLIDRIGRGAGFDLATGRTLWSRQGLMPRVHDIALEAGTLLIGGSMGPVDLATPGRDALASDPAEGVVLALDARSGQTVHRWQNDDTVRWVRLAPEGFAVVGLNKALVSLDLVRQRIRWRAESPRLFNTMASWVLPGRIIVRAEAAELWQLSSADGALRRRHLDLRGRFEQGFEELRVQLVGDKTGVTTRLGAALFDASGELAGVDLRETDGSAVLSAGFAESVIPLLDRNGQSDPLGYTSHTLTIFDADSLRAVSQTAVRIGNNLRPQDMALIDGRILITAGAVTTIISAPTQDPPQ